MNTDTIAAIATAPGQAGIGIVRISGPAALEVGATIFRSKKQQIINAFPARKMIYGLVCESEKGVIIDEALGVFMPAPHSYTGEDVFELQTHGSAFVLQKVLQLVLERGIRLAEPGEFSLRAFLNGRIDLVQAEAVMQVIQAKSDASLRQAQELLSGELSRQIEALRTSLLDCVVSIEAANDFPEDDIETIRSAHIKASLQKILASIDELLATASQGKVLREGLRTVIVGKPNVGKSTLLNTLLGEQRALVSEVPGTTRDTIEEWVNLNGIPLRLIDTAGLRDTTDRIEQLGIGRAKEYIRLAELVLLLFDASEPPFPQDLDILNSIPEVPVILVLNKSDRSDETYRQVWQQTLLSRQDLPRVYISATEKTGLDELKQAIERSLFSDRRFGSESVCLGSLRQQESLQLAKQGIQAALKSLEELFPVDCCVVDLRLAMQALGQITGQTVSDEIVKEIFAKFCLGK